MHVIIGALIVAGTFLWSMQYMSLEFDGFLNLYSAILLGGVPIGLTILTFRFASLAQAARGFFRTLGQSPERDRQRLAQNIVAFGREVRRDRGVAASAILDGERDPVFKALGRHVIQGTDEVEIEADAVVLGRRELEELERAEKVLATMGDFAPAMGMIGTVIGLIQLLANMRDFEKLGPGMAIALLTTFYGLLLAHLLYLPLARLVADHAQSRAANINLVVEGMLKLARKRPLHEVQELVGAPASAAVAPSEKATA